MSYLKSGPLRQVLEAQCIDCNGISSSLRFGKHHRGAYERRSMVAFGTACLRFEHKMQLP